MILSTATTILETAKDRDIGLNKSFRFLENTKLTGSELDFAKRELVKISNKIYNFTEDN